MQGLPILLALGGPGIPTTQNNVPGVTHLWLGGEQRREGWMEVWGILFCFKWDTFYAVLEHGAFDRSAFFKNHGTIFIKQELFHALQNELFLGCGISLIKPAKLFSPVIEDEPKLYSCPPVLN